MIIIIGGGGGKKEKRQYAMIRLLFWVCIVA